MARKYQKSISTDSNQNIDNVIPSIVPKTTKIKIKLEHLKDIKPLTDNQLHAFREYGQGQNIAMLGVPGSGKSFLAIYLAMKSILTKGEHVKKLVIVKSPVAVVNLGFIKGDIDQKSDVYKAPYVEIFKELFPSIQNPFETLVEQGIVEFTTTSYLRGITYHDSIIFIDECQNSTYNEMYMVLSRLGNNSKIIIGGDIHQNDLKKGEKTGYDNLIKVLDYMDCFTKIDFTVDDIVRSGFVKDFIMANIKLGLI